VTRCSFWPGRTAQGLLINDGRWCAKRWLVWSRAVMSTAKQWEGKSRVGRACLVTSGAVIRGAKPHGVATTSDHQRRALSTQ
jgi:hypothetical protein